MTQLDEAASADAVPEGATESAPIQMFVNDIPFGFDLAEDGISMIGDATLSDALRSPGTGLPRPSVLATIADCIAGVPACLATAPRLAVTLDIAVHNVVPPWRCGDRLEVAGEIVKQGRSTVAGEVRFSDAETQEVVALSYVTFMASPRPQDVAPVMLRGMRTMGSMPIAFPDYIGLRIVEPGVAEIDLVHFVMQASQSLQGGAVALLGEMAAESLTSAPILDLDVRYLSAVRIGPGRATATRFGHDLVRVEVRDVGSSDRLAALILVRVAAEQGGRGR